MYDGRTILSVDELVPGHRECKTTGSVAFRHIEVL